MSPDTHTVLVIAGPTAVGKTAVSLDVAGRLGTSILSADSRQCYREMSIGTAKPAPEELLRVPHYFIDEFPVTESLTAADYERLGLGYLEQIFDRHRVAVVCGGTGLYIRALCSGLDEMPETDPAITASVQAAYEQGGISWLQQAVREEDPAFFEQGEIHNPARMIRALSFVRSTGSSLLAYRQQIRKPRPFRVVMTCLELPRPLLYARIDQRVDQMMAGGLLEEARSLYPMRTLKNLQTVGYTELFDYFDGKYSLSEAVSKIKQHTRNYAKRQMTWFRKEPATWLRADDPQVIPKVLAALDA